MDGFLFTRWLNYRFFFQQINGICCLPSQFYFKEKFGFFQEFYYIWLSIVICSFNFWIVLKKVQFHEIPCFLEIQLYNFLQKPLRNSQLLSCLHSKCEHVTLNAMKSYKAFYTRKTDRRQSFMN